jgi:hypothetical protein
VRPSLTLKPNVLPSAKGQQIETEAAPIRYVAELLGTDTDSEKAIRWLIALMVLCCDPLAIALTVAASARINSRGLTPNARASRSSTVMLAETAARSMDPR